VAAVSTPGKLASSDDRPTCCSRCEEAWRYAQPWTPPLFRALIACDVCGNKRCPHATDHRLACEGSNGQPGSDYGVPTDAMKPLSPGGPVGSRTVADIALDAVRALHTPAEWIVGMHDGQPVRQTLCAECAVAMPCRTLAAIEEALA
jgi:hypothetical protein